jgi:uncharacterized protein Yka (UPF0111/DUF47 family)
MMPAYLARKAAERHERDISVKDPPGVPALWAANTGVRVPRRYAKRHLNVMDLQQAECRLHGMVRRHPECFELLARHAGLVTEACSQVVLLLACGGDREVSFSIKRLKTEGAEIARQLAEALRSSPMASARGTAIRDLMRSLDGALDALCQAAERLATHTTRCPAVDAKAVYEVVSEMQLVVIDLRQRRTPCVVLDRCQAIARLAMLAEEGLRRAQVTLLSRQDDEMTIVSLTDVHELLGSVATRCRDAAVTIPSIVL